MKRILRLFIQNPEDINDPKTRRQYGTLAGIVGVFFNILLFGAKLAIGMLANSVAVTADAFNNLSDAGSSAVTIFGFRMAGKPADKDHPFGHGRIEYISGMIVSFLILLVGYELFTGSFSKILYPEPVQAGFVTVLVLLISIAVKLCMGLFYQYIGNKINSASLKASMTDSLSDVVSTLAVLVSVVILSLFHVNIDGYIGIVISLIIFYAGIKSLREIVDSLLGQPPEKEFVQELKNAILSYEGVLGIHDLIVHNYGPNRCLVSVHVEVSAKEDVLKSHDLIDTIEKEVGNRMNLALVIHSDPIVNDDALTAEWNARIRGILAGLGSTLNMHDFRMVPGDSHSNLIFDVLVPYDCKLTNEEIKIAIDAEIHKTNPDYFTVITFDHSYI